MLRFILSTNRDRTDCTICKGSQEHFPWSEHSRTFQKIKRNYNLALFYNKKCHSFIIIGNYSHLVERKNPVFGVVFLT